MLGRLKTYYKIQLKNVDPSVELMQDSIERVLQPISSAPIVNGDLLTNITLVSGLVNKIEHKLGRPILGYIVVSKNANALIYDSQDVNSRPDLFINLYTTADCKISLWVF